MNTVLVSDVFGYTTALRTLANELQADHIIDPYDGIDMSFNNEKEAYSHFIDQVGLKTYAANLFNTIKSCHGVNLIGFSVGASAIWKLSEDLTDKTIKRAVGYYGAQIRHATELQPKFAIDLIFPESEPHFDVYLLQQLLAQKKQVSITQVTYLHGFMNKCSVNYNQRAYEAQLKWIGGL